MSAEREEVVVDPDALDAEHLLPDRDERSLERRARLDVRGILAIAVCARRGKALSVELSVRRARERIEEDETRRHHPLGQLERRSLTEDLFRERAALDLAQLDARSEEHTSELQSRENLVCRLLLEKKKKTYKSM